MKTPLLISVEFFWLIVASYPFGEGWAAAPGLLSKPVNFGQETQTSLFSKPANQQLARFEKPSCTSVEYGVRGSGKGKL